MSDNPPDVATIRAALEALEGAISFTNETRGLPGDPPDPDLLILAKARTALESLSARVTQDPREVAHIACDCVPDLGPMHCHLCSTKQGREVPWTDCEGRVTQAETESRAKAFAECAELAERFAAFTDPMRHSNRREVADAVARRIRAVAAQASPGTGNEASE